MSMTPTEIREWAEIVHEAIAGLPDEAAAINLNNPLTWPQREKLREVQALLSATDDALDEFGRRVPGKTQV